MLKNNSYHSTFVHRNTLVEVDNNRPNSGPSGPVTGPKIELKPPKDNQPVKKVIKQESDIRIETDAVPPAVPRHGRTNSKMTVGSKRSASGSIKNVGLNRSQKRLPKCVEPTRLKAELEISVSPKIVKNENFWRISKSKFTNFFRKSQNRNLQIFFENLKIEIYKFFSKISKSKFTKFFENLKTLIFFLKSLKI